MEIVNYSKANLLFIKINFDELNMRKKYIIFHFN